jgi:hypothetical protein
MEIQSRSISHTIACFSLCPRMYFLRSSTSYRLLWLLFKQNWCPWDLQKIVELLQNRTISISSRDGQIKISDPTQHYYPSQRLAPSKPQTFRDLRPRSSPRLRRWGKCGQWIQFRSNRKRAWVAENKHLCTHDRRRWRGWRGDQIIILRSIFKTTSKSSGNYSGNWSSGRKLT